MTTQDFADGCLMPAPSLRPGSSLGGWLPGSGTVRPCPRQGRTASAGVNTPLAQPGLSLRGGTAPVPAQVPSAGEGRARALAGGGYPGRPAPAGAQVSPDDGRCSAMVPVGGGVLAPCPDPPAGRYRGECGKHALNLAASGCLECITLPGLTSHDCPLTVTPEVTL